MFTKSCHARASDHQWPLRRRARIWCKRHHTEKLGRGRQEERRRHTKGYDGHQTHARMAGARRAHTLPGPLGGRPPFDEFAPQVSQMRHDDVRHEAQRLRAHHERVDDDHGPIQRALSSSDRTSPGDQLLRLGGSFDARRLLVSSLSLASKSPLSIVDCSSTTPSGRWRRRTANARRLLGD